MCHGVIQLVINAHVHYHMITCTILVPGFKTEGELNLSFHIWQFFCQLFDGKGESVTKASDMARWERGKCDLLLI